MYVGFRFFFFVCAIVYLSDFSFRLLWCTIKKNTKKYWNNDSHHDQCSSQRLLYYFVIVVLLCNLHCMVSHTHTLNAFCLNMSMWNWIWHTIHLIYLPKRFCSLFFLLFYGRDDSFVRLHSNLLMLLTIKNQTRFIRHYIWKLHQNDELLNYFIITIHFRKSKTNNTNAIESEKKSNEIFNCDLNYIDLILSTEQGFNIKKRKRKLKTKSHFYS